jgi:hypothetical protein
VGRALSDGSAGGTPLSPDTVLGLKVEFVEVEGAIECPPVVKVPVADAVVREKGDGIGRSLTEDT